MLSYAVQLNRTFSPPTELLVGIPVGNKVTLGDVVSSVAFLTEKFSLFTQSVTFA